MRARCSGGSPLAPAIFPPPRLGESILFETYPSAGRRRTTPSRISWRNAWDSPGWMAQLLRLLRLRLRRRHSRSTLPWTAPSRSWYLRNDISLFRDSIILRDYVSGSRVTYTVVDLRTMINPFPKEVIRVNLSKRCVLLDFIEFEMCYKGQY